LRGYYLEERNRKSESRLRVIPAKFVLLKNENRTLFTTYELGEICLPNTCRPVFPSFPLQPVNLLRLYKFYVPIIEQNIAPFYEMIFKSHKFITATFIPAPFSLE